jgi:hypothetical protein
MSATHRRGPTRVNQAAGTGRWLAAVGQHPWYLAIMAVAAFGLVAGSVTVLMQANSTPSHPAAAPNCGLINCGVAVAAPSVTTSAEIRIGKAHTTVSPRPQASGVPHPLTFAGCHPRPGQSPGRHPDLLGQPGPAKI